jgi:Tol biopolymer transport system component
VTRSRISPRPSLCFLCFLLAVTCAASPPGVMNGLAVSPDGKLIVVTYEKGDSAFIYKVSVDTGNATRLTKAETGWESSPSFWPDGKQIAFSYKPGKETRSRIIIENVGGSDLHQWSPAGVSDLSPVFSLDDKTVVFSRAEFYGNDSPITQPHPHEWDFYASDLDGTNVRQLTTESFYIVSPPSISPDGKTMVIVTEGVETSQHISVYSITHPGQPLHTFQPHVPKEVDHRNPIFASPNYLPDGSILFMAANSRFDYDVYRLNPDTGEIEKLTIGNGYASDLKVSADGNTAVFFKWQKNWLGDLLGNQVYLLDVQSQKLTLLRISGLN